ncbi:MAG: dihydrodipicolinate synthase family protein [Planctomycetaceae bacterium]|nr:dihydrodipicolinate synthase family protein [Planctomycetaceae bacterium]
MTSTVPVPPQVPRRRITGMSAVLLPFLDDDSIDWDSFDAHVTRTLDAGLIPAVNMDTGYVNLLDDAAKAEVLQRTQRITGGRRFVAGAFVADQPGASLNADEYYRRMEQIEASGGIPVIFQSWGLTQQSDDDIVETYRQIGRRCSSFIGFELGTIFLPFGKIYSLEVYEQLMGIGNCIGAKHSSLRRDLEWQRLDLKNRVRPDFMVLTGNDLAIDMVVYGSDYLLGLSSFAPDLFGKRDRMWEAADSDFWQLNDVLQYLGFFTFRMPVPAYKHSCAQFLHLREMIRSDTTHPKAQPRPKSDLPVLQDILRQLSDLN